MPLTLLIIDDDADDRELFCEAVKQVSETITCIQAASGEEAIELLKGDGHLKPDFIFLDLNMPKMNGKQCLRKLKAMQQVATVPVIIYSTSKLEEDRHDTLQLGAKAFFTKPSSLGRLMEAIRLILKHQWQRINSDIFFVM